VSCSRERKKLEWGIPVPGDDAQTIYVWFEALINYISALGFAENNERFRKLWPADVHCIGKDILRFHSLLWPTMLLSLGLKFPKTILVHGYLTSGGQKMSKSLGNVIDPFELVEKYGTDAVRYYLLREIPPTEDGDFTYEKFKQRYNSDLASGIGNLVSRLTTMAERGVNKIKPDNSNKVLKEITPRINEAFENYKKSLEGFRFSEALKAIWGLISFCDKQIEKEKLWEKKDGSSETLWCLLFTLSNVAQMLQPFLPETSEKIFEQLGIKPTDKKPREFKIKKEKPLFPRI
jgi:methionyl-tRNA synthetase